jgi:hypothetical protein
LTVKDRASPGRRVEEALAGKGLVRPVAVVVLDVGPEQALDLSAVDDQEPVETFAPQVPTKRSAWAFALGAQIGVRMISIPSPRKISSKPPANYASRSWMRKRQEGVGSSRARKTV